MKKYCFLLLGCFVESIWSDIVALLLKSFLGPSGEGAGPAALKAGELLSRLMLACSRAIVADYFWDISFDKQIFAALVSGSGHDGGISFGISCISFSKCKHRDTSDFMYSISLYNDKMKLNEMNCMYFVIEITV